MKLSELEQGSNIILHVNIDGKFADFSSVVLYVNKESAVAETIKINNKVVSFSGDNVKLDMSYIRDGKAPFFWRGIMCETFSENGKALYRITSSSEGIERNRREAFRLFLGISGVAQMGINNRALDIIVKDVSQTGFSFVSDRDFGEVINMPVRMVFTDLNKNFSLMGIVVRKVEISENKIVYGCRLSVENELLPQYINIKQRQQLSMKRENDDYKLHEKMRQSLKETNNSTLKAALGGKDKRKGNYNSDFKRNISDVEKVERRGVFKQIHSGKKM